MPASPYLLPVWGWIALAAAMTALWLRQRRTGDASPVDLAWTAGIGGLAVLYAFATDGWLPRRALVASLAGFWALRLSAYLMARIRTGHEDSRYRSIREDLGERVQPWFFVFFQAQALLAALLSVVFLLLCLDPAEGFRTWELVGVAVWVLGMAGESIADRQLAAWKSDPGNRGRTCRAGLWRYSRHPNYFFEWTLWLAYGFMSVGAPNGWIVWLAPALMLFLILRVTGVPPAEQQALKSRGDDYRDYQRSTNAFFPGPVRRSTAH